MHRVPIILDPPACFLCGERARNAQSSDKPATSSNSSSHDNRSFAAIPSGWIAAQSTLALPIRVAWTLVRSNRLREAVGTRAQSLRYRIADRCSCHPALAGRGAFTILRAAGFAASTHTETPGPSPFALTTDGRPSTRSEPAAAPPARWFSTFRAEQSRSFTSGNQPRDVDHCLFTHHAGPSRQSIRQRYHSARVRELERRCLLSTTPSLWVASALRRP